MKYRQTSLLLFIIFLISACKAQPNSKEIKDCVKKHYDQLSLQDGGSTYKIEDITIVEVIKTKVKGEYKAKTIVKGTSANFSLPTTEEERDFEEKIEFLFTKNKAGLWECRRKVE